MASILRVSAMLVMVMAAFHPGHVLGGHSKAKVDIKILKEGDGATAIRHSMVKVHYTGWLMDGTKFDSSVDRGTPFEFTVGAGQVIPGWNSGVEGMKVGGKRELIIPPELAYGSKGAGEVIPPNATLKFTIALLSLTPPKYSNIDNAALKVLLDRDVKIVDLRRKGEWKKTGVIKNSKLLTAFDGAGKFIRSFPAALREYVATDEEVVLICGEGVRSSMIANMLTEQAGYTTVYNVTDGIERWLKDGNSVVPLRR